MYNVILNPILGYGKPVGDSLTSLIRDILRPRFHLTSLIRGILCPRFHRPLATIL
jgi:hypothetical protein